MRRVDESYQPVERDRKIGSPAVWTIAVVGIAVLVVTVALFWWTRTGDE